MRTAIIASPRRHQQSRGSSMVESALTFTVFFMMVFGIVEFGRAVYAYNQIAYLSQQAARYASMRGSSLAPADQATTASVSSYASGLAVGLTTSNLNITTTWQNGANTPGNWVNVKVVYPFTFLAPYLPGAPLNMGATAQLVIVR